MLTALLLVVTSALPPVSAGPDLVDQAKKLDLPIHTVTVFSDRALVRRQQRHSLPAGVQVVQFPDLPGAAWLDSLRVDSSLGKVLRVEAIPVDRERFSIDQVDDYISQLEKLGDARAALEARGQLAQQELNLLGQATPLAPVDPAERKNNLKPGLNPKAWVQIMGFLDQRRSQARVALLKVRDARLDLDKKIAALQRQIAQHKLGAFSQQRIQVVAMLQLEQAGSPTLSLEYFVPGAAWMPTYELHFDPRAAQATLQTGAKVWQASGESWDGVQLLLSTSIPGRGIELPKLMTWTLGEKREWIPVPRPKKPLPTPKAYAPVAHGNSQAQRMAERRAQLQQRLVVLQSLLNSSPSSGATLTTGMGQSNMLGGMARMQKESDRDWRRARRQKQSARRPSPPPAPSYAEAPMAANEPYPMEMDEESGSRPSVSDMARGLMAKSRKADKVRRTSLALFEPQSYRPPQVGDPNLPANLAGGFDYVYKAAASSAIPSDGQQIRVPLSAETYPVQTFYEATPALATTAYLKASVINKGERPILRGPIAVFVDGDFTSDGTLQTTGKGGRIDLPLGADEDLRILRRVEPQTETKGFIGKKEVTTYRCVIQVANYKKHSVEVLVHDQIPKTNNEEITVKLLSAKPAQSQGPDIEGMLHWRLKIPAAKTRTVEYSYQIIRPDGWQLVQR